MLMFMDTIIEFKNVERCYKSKENFLKAMDDVNFIIVLSED